MNTNKYIIKSFAPWMIDELISFSRLSKFDLILLRKQDAFYDKAMEELKLNGIDIYLQPKSYNNFIKKLLTVLSFFFANVFKFQLNYNGVIGFKSLGWFLRLDLSLFSEKSNLHAQFATQSAIISFLIKRYFKNKPKYSFTFHAYDIYYKNAWFNTLVKYCLCAFSISNYNIQYIENNYKKSDKITLSRLGVFIHPENVEKMDKSQNPKVFTIGVLSWFVEKKGIAYLLKAMHNLQEQGYNKIVLKIAGGGPLESEYLSFIKNYDLKSVELVGKLYGDQKKDFYNSLDLFVLPSIALENDMDGIPVVLMEAIAYGIPIVSTNVSGIPEICINNYNGYLIKERNVDEIVTSILSIYTEVDKRKIFSKNSIKLSSEYDIINNSMHKIELLEWDKKQMI